MRCRRTSWPPGCTCGAGESVRTSATAFAGRRIPGAPATGSFQACHDRQIHWPGYGLAPYSPPTRWRFDERCGGGGFGAERPPPPRPRCPSRLPEADTDGKLVASRHRGAWINSCTSGRTGARTHSSGGILSRRHWFGPTTPETLCNSLSAAQVSRPDGPSSSRMRAMAARWVSGLAQASSSRSLSARVNEPPIVMIGASADVLGCHRGRC